MKLLTQTYGIKIAFFASFLLLSGLNLFADGKYVLDWRYTIDNDKAMIRYIWLIDNDSTIYANVTFDDNFFLNVNTQKVERYLKNPLFDGYTNRMSYDGKTVYAFAKSLFKVDAKSGEIKGTNEWLNFDGSCLCGDIFVTRDERLYLIGHDALNSKNLGLISYYKFDSTTTEVKKIPFDFTPNHTGKSIEQVYMTKEGKYLIFIQRYGDKNPDKSGYELYITDTAATTIYFKVSGTSKFTVSDDETLLAYCISTNDNDKRVVIMDLKNFNRLDSITLEPAPTEKYIVPPHLEAPINFSFSKDNSFISIGSLNGSMIINIQKKENSHYINTSMKNVFFSEDNMHLYFSINRYIFSYKEDTTSNVENDLQEIELTLNPNPANYNLKLTYFNPKESNIKIDLMNLAGQEVQQLFSGIETQGRIEHNFNLSSIPSSSYAIRISIDNKIYFKNFIKE